LKQDGMTAWLYPSQQFASQPRGVMEIFFNTDAPLNDIKAKVLLALWDDLYSLQQSALATEASIAGMQLRMTTGTGVALTIGGFTDKQSQLIEQALRGLRVSADEQSFMQAKDRYIRGLQ